jgi:hypothetical protein
MENQSQDHADMAETAALIDAYTALTDQQRVAMLGLMQAMAAANANKQT